MSFVERIFAIREKSFSHDDVKIWVTNLFDELFGLPTAPGVRTEVYLAKGGRADIIAEEDIVIEVKKFLDTELAAAEAQLPGYFEAREELNVGIATDGIGWRFYVRSGDTLHEYHSFTVSRDWLDETLKEEISFATAPLHRREAIPLTPKELASTFRLHQPMFNLCRNLLESIGSTSQPFPTQFRAWMAEYRSVYPGFNDVSRRLGEGDLERGAEELFLRHSYLVVLVKVIMQAFILREDLVHEFESRPEDVAVGTPLLQRGVRIAELDDYFSWIAEGSSDDLRRLLRELFNALLSFDIESVNEDVFRLLYEEVVDKETRHRLGEFYTPKWLAQFLVREAVENPHARVIDPASGSGTFLVEAIKYKAELLEKDEPLEEHSLRAFLDEVYGFDINPMAVFIASANVFLAVAGIAIQRGIPIPTVVKPNVFVADSLSRERLRQYPDITGEGLAFVTLASKFIPVPKSVKTMNDAFAVGNELGRVTETYVEHMQEGAPHPEALEAALAVADPNLKEVFGDILYLLRDELKSGDRIWGFVYRNKVVPLMVGQFDAVVGNPPWLVYRDMDPRLQEFMDFIAKKRDIRPDPKVKNSFDLAVAFTLACQRYLRPGGRLAFVLPGSVLAGLQHLRFLERVSSGTDGLRLLEAHDLRDVSPPPFPHGIPAIGAIFELVGE